MNAKPVVLGWSGGKDCALALEWLREDASFDVVALLTMVTAGEDRVSVHSVRRSLLREQAARTGIRLVEVELPAAPSNEVYEAAFRSTIALLLREAPQLRDIAFGDIHLADVRAYREHLAGTSGLVAHFPLWGSGTAALADESISRGIEARIVCVDTQALGAAWAGLAYDRQLLAALPPGIDPCGEHGEFHTFVTAAPFMRGRVACRVGATTLRDERFAWCDLVPAAQDG
jgi:uncharacterized protein (TIGR00290 family)